MSTDEFQEKKLARFGRPRRLNLHAQVVQEIGTRIVGGKLRPGQTLPNEPELGRELSVSRSVLREAIKSLSAKGLVESRTRTGTLVRDRIHWNLLDPDVLMWWYRTMPRADFFRKLFEARGVVEPAAAELAARKADERDITALRTACEAMEAANPTSDEAIEADLAFHRAVLVASRNELLSQMGSLMGLGLLTSFRISTRSYAISLPLHRPVFEAIRTRRPKRARTAMQRLLSRTLKFTEHELIAPERFGQGKPASARRASRGSYA